MFPNIDSDPPFCVGQPIWFDSSMFDKIDYTCMIIHDFKRGLLGSWMALVIPEYGKLEDMRCVPCKYLMDNPPSPAAIHRYTGNYRRTSNGAILREVDVRLS